MAGYIGKSQGVTQVDGYNRTEADDRYVNASGDTMTGALTLGSARTYFGKDGGNHHWFAAADVSSEPNSLGYGFVSNGSIVSDHKFYTNGLPRLAIDPDGRVTMPYQPYFRARVDGQVNISTIGEVLPFGVVDTNIGGNYNASTYRFTAPVSGRYVFHLMIFAPPNSLVRQYFRLNSTNLQSLEWYNDTVNYVNRVDTMTLYLSANDYVDTVHWQGTTHINGNWSGPNSYFSGYLIG